MLELGLYVHVPFCARKCGYCDFYSKVPRPEESAPLVDALLRELDRDLPADVCVATIFVGGGTPTVLPTEDFGRLFGALGQIARGHRPVEFSVEANPASLTDEKAAILRAAGVNRISLGAQSFHPAELALLERIHSPADIEASVEAVRRAGFEHLNLDLIFGIPGQMLASWRGSLARAVELGPDHLACYGLTFEPGTPFDARGQAGLLRPMDEDAEAELYAAAIDELSARGFEQYEISNFARLAPGSRCEHNLRYWRNQPTLGIGPSAVSYVHGRRWRNVPDVAEYAARVASGGDPVIHSEELTPAPRAGETAMLQLRLVDGIQPEAFRNVTGFDPLALFAEPIARYSSAGLLTAGPDRIALTRAGRLVADTILADFLTPEPCPR